MSVKSRITQLNARLAEKLTAKGVGADGSETATALIDKVDDIPQGGESGGLDLFPYIQSLQFGADIREITEDIVLHLERAIALSNMFDLKELNAPKVTVYISDACTTIGRAFGRAKGAVEVIEIIGDTRNVTNFNQTFQQRQNLREIIARLDFSSATTAYEMFNNTTALTEFRVVPNTLSLSLDVKYSPDLSNETLQSIKDGYKDMTGQTSPVLTLHADVKNRMTDEQKAAFTSKNVTIA